MTFGGFIQDPNEAAGRHLPSLFNSPCLDLYWLCYIGVGPYSRLGSNPAGRQKPSKLTSLAGHIRLQDQRN